MRYQPLLFPGVFVLAIASLLIVQSCTKNDRADTQNDRTDTQNDRTDTENNRADSNRDLELEHAGSQATHYIMAYHNTKYKPDRDKYRDQALPHISIIKKRCKSNDRVACNLLLSLQKLDGNMDLKEQMDDLVGK
jgi:hypothetical protein